MLSLIILLISCPSPPLEPSIDERPARSSELRRLGATKSDIDERIVADRFQCLDREEAMVALTYTATCLLFLAGRLRGGVRFAPGKGGCFSGNRTDGKRLHAWRSGRLELG